MKHKKLNKAQKQKVQEHVLKINGMDLFELQQFAQSLYLNKQDIHESIFYWTERAIDIQTMVLRDATNISPMAVMSELKEGEI